MNKSFVNLKTKLLRRWSDEDFPGAQKRFQLSLLGKDLFIFIFIPISTIVFYKIVEASVQSPSNSSSARKRDASNPNKEKVSQIIVFSNNHSGQQNLASQTRSPGTLVRVKLLNAADVGSTTPIHAQIIDHGLGREYIGGTIVGEASPESGSGRVKIEFKFVRHPRDLTKATPISARALSLDGRFGIEASKKEGLFARSALKAGTAIASPQNEENQDNDFRSLIVRAVASGLIQELQGEAQSAYTKSQILFLPPQTEFFVELTDFFPGKR